MFNVIPTDSTWRASGPVEIVDIRHYGSAQIRRLIQIESAAWMNRLHWDFQLSSSLLMQYLDAHSLPGYAAVRNGQIIGYTFCVYEGFKAILGDVFAIPDEGTEPGYSATKIEHMLLRHALETLLHSPGLNRIESQFLLQPAGTFRLLFEDAGFDVIPRQYLLRSLQAPHATPSLLPPELLLRTWRQSDTAETARLIVECYKGHADSGINDQYRTQDGAEKFLHNIFRYTGCGAFSHQASLVIVDLRTQRLAAVLLGSKVGPACGHITQLCVSPAYRRLGLARHLLASADEQFRSTGAEEVSLTVTESNTDAIALYLDSGFTLHHRFDAAVWRKGSQA